MPFEHMIMCKVLEQGHSSDARVVDRAGGLGEQQSIKRQRDDDDEERQQRPIKQQHDDKQDERLRKASGEPDSPIVID